MENKSNKLNIEFVEYIGYYIPKTDLEGFNPDTYFDGPKLDENGISFDENCQNLGYCKLKAEKRKCSNYKKPVNQIEVTLK
jgi:hypothetical protein